MSYRTLTPSFSRTLVTPARFPYRSLSTSLRRNDILSELEEKLHPRELVERKKKLMEEKYGEKLKRAAEKEGVQDIEELKKKVLQPKIDAAKEAARLAEKKIKAEKQLKEDPVEKKVVAERKKKEKREPLSSIINLPLIHLTPHDTNAISQIWNAYHTSHPTLSNSFLSASLPASTYASMIALAKQNPFFVIPLPQLSEAPVEAANHPEMKTDEYEMFYLQWLFHPTPTSSSPPSSEASPEPLPLTTSAIFTPLKEFKKSGEWAQPYLVLTHYPDLAQTHSLILMRGEISPASASGPPGSLANPGFLLSQQQAQLLALALQRFYCTDIAMPGESAKQVEERLKRQDALRGFRERPGEWDWMGLVEMAYGGLV
ncbi:ATP synthase mitochondrial F1 complex assembly factor 1 [Cryptococcus bacillisporus CA1873]|uniref:ATP synthase mitochondrial F1 complex assembly factor 1 n=1 Tax=Cryptococcus bacillisporus CA1873 TaxID=1296111 RepID=A0ABR5BC88_CRYGA|nr:ATP synthase mitochondrial F1 complex assembly factor 1 [Cryptococcus bacillisporus CA1873]|eukprot:KIR63920.1 ATP synthase mitochondrial F1 complex assembly factor 1 [Cryptococcus gattii CA1873]